MIPEDLFVVSTLRAKRKEKKGKERESGVKEGLFSHIPHEKQ